MRSGYLAGLATPLALSCLSLFGCAGTASQPRSSAGSELRGAPEAVWALLSVRTGKQGAWRPVRAGDTLRSGDELSLEVEAVQPTYVYLARASASGSFVGLFTNEAGQRATASAPLRIPGESGELLLGQEAGKEDLRVVASLQPLSSTQFLDLATGYQTDRTRDPPPVATDNKRNPFALRAAFDRSGSAVLRFAFLHQ